MRFPISLLNYPASVNYLPKLRVWFCGGMDFAMGVVASGPHNPHSGHDNGVKIKLLQNTTANKLKIKPHFALCLKIFRAK